MSSEDNCFCEEKNEPTLDVFFTKHTWITSAAKAVNTQV